MQIDWFTFGAQVINFLILIGLLKRFLYGPIVSAMDEREARISARLADAREQREAAQAEAEKYRALQEQLENERSARLATAEQEAAARREQLVREAREEVAHLEQEWRDSLQRARDSFLRELSERALRETMAVAQRVLTDLADADLQTRAVTAFFERLESLEGQQREELAEGLRSAHGEGVVRSAVELPPDLEQRLTQLLADLAGATPTLTFEVNPALGVGIELRVAERKVAWSLKSYLNQLTEQVRERLDAELRKGHSRPSRPAVASPASLNQE